VRTMTRDLHSKHRSHDWRGLAELGLFSAGIIHEVKNSLQGLANALFLLESDAELKPRAREHVAIARHELSRAFDISSQTLALVREEEPVTVCLADVLEEVLNTYAAKIAHKHIKIERRYDFAGKIASHPGALRQAFSNLVLNALESAPRETGKLTIHTYPCPKSQCEKTSGVQIEFADNGPGIPEKYRERIFEPLFSTKAGKGSGLGLWVSRQLVHKQHGQLRLRERGECGESGTCFSVFLPLAA